jgi:hypothetical protein
MLPGLFLSEVEKNEIHMNYAFKGDKPFKMICGVHKEFD